MNYLRYIISKSPLHSRSRIFVAKLAQMFELLKNELKYLKSPALQMLVERGKINAKHKP